jgi:hypothetical protein
MTGVGGPLSASAVAALGKFGDMQVTPETVLGVYGVVAEEVTRLRTSVQRFQIVYGQAGVPPLGGDPVSPYASKGFNTATAQLVTKCNSAVADLKTVADGLAEAARAYGKTEDQIKAAFDPGLYHYKQAPVTPSTSDAPAAARTSLDPAPAQRSRSDLMPGGAH